MGAEDVVYSIQRTYVLNTLLKPNKAIITCDQRIDIPTIEPLTKIKFVSSPDLPVTVIPCIEIVFDVSAGVYFTLETNEGVTVLPIVIEPGQVNPIINPYRHYRFVLVLPRGTTGVKSCKLFTTDSNIEIQHNFTFGIMPPPYNYDNALFGYLSYGVEKNRQNIGKVSNIFSSAFENLREGLYKIQVQSSGFPMTSSHIPENYRLSMIKFRVTNKTGAKALLELEFTYRTANHSKGNDMFALPIADGDNSVIIDIDKGTIITVSDSTSSPFMVSFLGKHGDHVITALNKASIRGDTSAMNTNYSYYFKPVLIP